MLSAVLVALRGRAAVFSELREADGGACLHFGFDHLCKRPLFSFCNRTPQAGGNQAVSVEKNSLIPLIDKEALYFFFQTVGFRRLVPYMSGRDDAERLRIAGRQTEAFELPVNIFFLCPAFDPASENMLFQKAEVLLNMLLSKLLLAQLLFSAASDTLIFSSTCSR